MLIVLGKGKGKSRNKINGKTVVLKSTLCEEVKKVLMANRDGLFNLNLSWREWLFLRKRLVVSINEAKKKRKKYQTDIVCWKERISWQVANAYNIFIIKIFCYIIFSVSIVTYFTIGSINSIFVYKHVPVRWRDYNRRSIKKKKDSFYHISAPCHSICVYVDETKVDDDGMSSCHSYRFYIEPKTFTI